MRKALATLAVLAGLLAPAVASAQAPGHPFGLGLVSGWGPNFGFTGKYWLDRDTSLQGSIGWTWYDRARPMFAFDWQRRVGNIVPRTHVVRFGFDVGVGGALGVVSGCFTDLRGETRCYADNRAALLLRVPLTFAAWFPRPQIEAYAEVTPSIDFLPELAPVLMGGIGGRFYF